MLQFSCIEEKRHSSALLGTWRDLTWLIWNLTSRRTVAGYSMQYWKSISMPSVLSRSPEPCGQARRERRSPMHVAPSDLTALSRVTLPRSTPTSSSKGRRLVSSTSGRKFRRYGTGSGESWISPVRSMAYTYLQDRRVHRRTRCIILALDAYRVYECGPCHSRNRALQMHRSRCKVCLMASFQMAVPR